MFYLRIKHRVTLIKEIPPSTTEISSGDDETNKVMEEVYKLEQQ